MKKIYCFLITFSGLTACAQIIPSTVGQTYQFCVGDTFEYRYSEIESTAGCGITATKLNIVTAYTVSGDTITYTYTSLISGNHSPCPNYSPPYGTLFDSTLVTQRLAHPDSSIFCPTTGLGSGSCQGLSSSDCYDSVYISSSGILIGKKLNEHNTLALSSTDDIWCDSLGLVYSNVFEEAYSTRYITNLIFYHKACSGESRGTFQPFPDYSIYAGISDLFDTVAIDLYPNPASNNFEIEVMSIFAISPASIIKLSITNLLGQKIFNKQVLSDKSNIDCSAWPKGLYIWSVNFGGNQQKIGKLEVE